LNTKILKVKIGENKEIILKIDTVMIFKNREAKIGITVLKIGLVVIVQRFKSQEK
jgi:hypothetical protein